MSKLVKRPSLFSVNYRDPKDGQIVTLKARSIRDSALGLSFVAVSDFVFDTDSALIKPTEEQLKKRFEGVKSLHISIYSILSIEELSDDPLRFRKTKSNLIALPKS